MLLQFRHLRFLPAPAALCLIDACLTLFGQPSAYWWGDRTTVNELSPGAYRLLALHPAAFAAGTIVWLAVFSLLLLLLPRASALFLAMAVTLGHAVGACTWLWQWEKGGYQAGVGLCLLTSFGLMASVLWEETEHFRTRAVIAPWNGRREWFRWSFVLLLATVPVMAFLWPN